MLCYRWNHFSGFTSNKANGNMLNTNVFTWGVKPQQIHSEHLGNHHYVSEGTLYALTVGCGMKGCSPSGGLMEHDTTGQNITDFTLIYINAFIPQMVCVHISCFLFFYATPLLLTWARFPLIPVFLTWNMTSESITSSVASRVQPPEMEKSHASCNAPFSDTQWWWMLTLNESKHPPLEKEHVWDCMP